ncbi:hypothetical protein B0H14DRAFT_2978372 [Mycena olivaceomarginata]|nr:hypothetical protein B0H14DRAFT_2978372 [Mycena olivaceomarginata]
MARNGEGRREGSTRGRWVATDPGAVYEVDVKAELPVDGLGAGKADVRRGASRERGCMDLLPEPGSPCRGRSVVHGALPVYELRWTRWERKQRRVRGRVVMHMPAVSSATDLLPRRRGGRGERAAVDSLSTGRGGGRRVRNDDEADPDAQRAQYPCPCPCARGAASSATGL